MDILSQYIMTKPSAQNLVDLFAGEWSSVIPADVTSGTVDLFHDNRIKLIEDQIDGGFKDKNILELGPLEGAHSYMMSQTAGHVTSVEANSRALIKCLIVKELLNLHNVNFLLGDFDKYLSTSEKFDFILACGVIYHCKNPVETICKLTEKTDEIGIWSHYFIEEHVRPKYGEKFDVEPSQIEYNGHVAQCYRHNYAEALELNGYCGGGNLYTRWMTRESWFSLFETLGFELNVLSESVDHPHGPEFTAVAKRLK